MGTDIDPSGTFSFRYVVCLCRGDVTSMGTDIDPSGTFSFRYSVCLCRGMLHPWALI